MPSKLLYFGIYGFELTHPTEVGQFRLYPRTTKYEDAKNYARDSENFNLTAIGECSGGLNSKELYERLYDLSAAMTFCEQQWVVIMPPFADEEIGLAEQALEKAKKQLEWRSFRQGKGHLIPSDSFDTDARRNFLELCLSKLADPAFCEQTALLPAFFRNVESLKFRTSYLDLTYYMDFSALEILARRYASDYTTTNVAQVLTPFLKHLGYNVQQSNTVDRHLGMENYARARNALFHNGQFETTFNENGKQVTIRLIDYETKLRLLLSDVLLKVIGYDDPHINWNRWLDRMPFK